MEINEILASRIQTEATPNGGKLIVVYSQPGGGKTSTFCQPPNTLLIECKDYSSDSLKEAGVIRADLPVIKTTGFEDAVDTISALAEGGHSFRNVVIDGGSGLSDWLNSDVLAGECEGDAAKFAGWGYGEKIASTRWQRLVDEIIDLVNTGVWVFVLCHKAVSTEKNPQGHDYLKNTIALSREKMAPLTRYVDAVLFIDFIIGEVSVNKVSGTAKVKGGETRVMYTRESACYEAKNRLNLPPVIELGNSPQEAFKAFFSAVKAGKKISTKEAK